jgi:25S rRNA (adenine2142-N1)-methyltransferase
MGSHRTTIRRKKPLTHLTTTKLPRRKAIKTLHTNLKPSTASDSTESIPLTVYQQASSKGQDPLRGGDSSKVLVQWLKEGREKEKCEDVRVLEVGCLEVDNAIAKYVAGQKATIRRIDLKSRDPRIEEQDFMTLPLSEVPLSITTKYSCQGYDLISLSLVLNFVSTPQGRYEMLKRTTSFLRLSYPSTAFPALFIVLPLPCVNNSRYLTQDHFLDIMKSLGYTLLKSKESKRMAYWLFHFTPASKSEKMWKKKVIHDGGGRNNFAIAN